MNKSLSIPVFLFTFLASSAFAAGIFPGDSMPPLTDDWRAPVNTPPVVYTIDLKLLGIKFKNPSESFPLPPIGGGWGLGHSAFFDIIELNLDFLLPSFPGELEFKFKGTSQEGSIRRYENELTRMSTTTGGTELFINQDIRLRESPTIASTGQTVVTDIGGGYYHIDSFFDIFTELSVDGGQSWIPGDKPMRVELIPEPATILLLGLGALLLRKQR